jgi:hypothetical protein
MSPSSGPVCSLIPACRLWYYRIWRLKGANNAIDAAKAKNSVSGYDVESLSLALHFFWHRLIATAFGWFANDFVRRRSPKAGVRPS